MHIRRATENDFEGMWAIFHDVVAHGDTYVFSPDATRDDAFAYWFGPGVIAYVAEEKERIAGMYKLIPNQRDLGAHVANAGVMVSPDCHGQGVGKSLAQHCLMTAREAGFKAMQFNFVVSTNTAAVELWKKMGFKIVGVLPRVFNHAVLGYVDAFVMHRFLD